MKLATFHRTAVVLSTLLWGIAVLGSLAGVCQYFICPLFFPTYEGDWTRTYQVALTLIFAPWVFAYAGTRVLYGIETILEG